MLIRSQDKKRLVKMNSILIEKITKRQGREMWPEIVGYGIYNYENGSDLKIAEYSTEEKAIKVLDMVQNGYQYCEECKYIGVGASQPEFVFQMPQDNEV